MPVESEPFRSSPLAASAVAPESALSDAATCPSCGAPLPQGASTCFKCGGKGITKAVATPVPAAVGLKPAEIVMGFGVALIGIAIMMYVHQTGGCGKKAAPSTKVIEATATAIPALDKPPEPKRPDPERPKERFPIASPRTDFDELADKALDAAALSGFVEEPSGADEFQLERNKKELATKKKNLSGSTFLLTTKGELGTFDFKKKAFPIVVECEGPWTDGPCKSVKRERFFTPGKGGVIQEEVQGKAKSYWLPVPEDEAETVRAKATGVSIFALARYKSVQTLKTRTIILDEYGGPVRIDGSTTADSSEDKTVIVSFVAMRVAIRQRGGEAKKIDLFFEKQKKKP